MNRKRKSGEDFMMYRDNQENEAYDLKKKLKGGLLVEAETGKPFFGTLKRNSRIIRRHNV